MVGGLLPRVGLVWVVVLRVIVVLVCWALGGLVLFSDCDRCLV